MAEAESQSRRQRSFDAQRLLRASASRYFPLLYCINVKKDRALQFSFATGTEKARDGGGLSDDQSQTDKHRKKRLGCRWRALTHESSPHPALAFPFLETFSPSTTPDARTRHGRSVRENGSREGSKRSQGHRK